MRWPLEHSSLLLGAQDRRLHNYLCFMRLINGRRQGVWKSQPAQLDIGYAAVAAEGAPAAAASVLRCAMVRPAIKAHICAAVPQRWDLQRQYLQERTQPA